MYKVIGKNGEEYGPIGLEEMRVWVGERRVVGSTLVKAEGTDQWMPLEKVPELAILLTGAPTLEAPPPVWTPSDSGVQKTSFITLLGFWLSMASLVFYCLWPLSIVGIVLSIVGFVEIGEKPNHLKGKRLALAGILIGALSLAWTLLDEVLGLI